MRKFEHRTPTGRRVAVVGQPKDIKQWLASVVDDSMQANNDTSRFKRYRIEITIPQHSDNKNWHVAATYSRLCARLVGNCYSVVMANDDYCSPECRAATERALQSVSERASEAV